MIMAVILVILIILLFIVFMVILSKCPFIDFRGFIFYKMTNEQKPCRICGNISNVIVSVNKKHKGIHCYIHEEVWDE